MADIAVIGTGYVGLVAGALLADFGHHVICMDVDESKIEQLRQGQCPIYEPGLKDYLIRNMEEGRLFFTTDCRRAIQENELIFICVGTPEKEDGGADLQYVRQVAKTIGKHMNGYKVVVDKSTVPVGTGRKVRDVIESELRSRRKEYLFDVVSNPEFLREGSAVNDFLHPDRVVIGAESEKAKEKMREVYRVLYLNETPFVETNVETAEVIKYASNAFLALKIAYINEIANLCEAVGANVQEVAKAMGRDGRISPKFLHAGPGYGGSCFPKDTKALVKIAKDYGEGAAIVEAAIASNEAQKRRMVTKITSQMGNVLQGKTIAALGVTFKPNTDDMREAPSLTILPALIEKGAQIRLYDPKWEKEGPWRFQEYISRMEICEDAYDAAKDADALVLITEWNHFRGLDMDRLQKQMKGRAFFDLRNVYSKKEMEAIGWTYVGVGC